MKSGFICSAMDLGNCDRICQDCTFYEDCGHCCNEFDNEECTECKAQELFDTCELEDKHCGTCNHFLQGYCTR